VNKLPGVRGTYVAPDCVHTYYAQMLTYRPEELSGLPLDAFCRALTFEGVPGVSRVGPSVHQFAIFQDKEFFGKGWPWKYRHVGRERSYENLAFPNVDALRASTFLIGLPGGFVTRDMRAIAEIVEAFRKVTSHADKIRKASA
jgi:hypothetical protein